MTVYNNQVIIGNYTIKDKIKLQKYFNLLEVKPYIYEDDNLQIAFIYA